MVVFSNNNYFLFLSPNLTNGECCINPIETSGFFLMVNSRFLVHGSIIDMVLHEETISIICTLFPH
jgi:hypothetical protein